MFSFETLATNVRILGSRIAVKQLAPRIVTRVLQIWRSKKGKKKRIITSQY